MGHGIWGGCYSGIFGGFGGLGLLGPIWNLVITAATIIGVVVLVIWAVRRLSSSQKTSWQSGSMQSPLEILKARYAGGEITRDEYQEMLKDLK